MRIGLLTHQWPGARMGGIGSATRECANSLILAGHEVHVFTFTLPADARAPLPAGLHLHETPDLARRVVEGRVDSALAAAIGAGGEGCHRLAMACMLSAAAMELHRILPLDVVEAPEVEALGLPLMFMESRPAVVTHLHCCSAIAREANGHAHGPAEALISALEHAAICLADGRLAATGAVVRETQKYIDTGNVEIIPHPVDLAGAPAASAARVESPGSADRKPQVAVFAGRLERLKGVEWLADALNLCLVARPDAKFAFIGPDTRRDDGGSMQHWIKSRLLPAVRGRVEFTGEATSAEVRRRMESAAFCVMPSLRENFSMALCEAMALGKAVIVGSGTGSVELVGNQPLVAPTEDAPALAAMMEWLYSDAAARDRLGAQCRGRIETLCDPMRAARLREAAYGRAIERRRAGNTTAALAALKPEAVSALLSAMAGVCSFASGARIAGAPTPAERLLTIMQSGAEFRDVRLFGAGKHTSRLLAERCIWESKGHRVCGIIDEHPRFASGGDWLGLPVTSLADACRLAHSGADRSPIVLSTDTYEELFWARTDALRKAGVPVARLYGMASEAAARAA